MTLFVKNPSDPTTGIIIQYSTCHNLVREYASSHGLPDLIYSRSPEHKEALYEILSKHSLKTLTIDEYKSLPSPKPAEGIY